MSDLAWPALTSNFNIIKNVIVHMKNQMTADAGSLPRSKQQLIHRVFEEWRKIPEFFIKQLYASISKRLSTVVTARSYSTKYLFDLKVTSVFNFELWKSKKLYLRYGFIELVFMFVCPLADKTRANQATTKLIGVIHHLLASEVLQYFCPPTFDFAKHVSASSSIISC